MWRILFIWATWAYKCRFNLIQIYVSVLRSNVKPSIYWTEDRYREFWGSYEMKIRRKNVLICSIAAEKQGLTRLQLIATSTLSLARSRTAPSNKSLSDHKRRISTTIPAISSSFHRAITKITRYWWLQIWRSQIKVRKQTVLRPIVKITIPGQRVYEVDARDCTFNLVKGDQYNNNGPGVTVYNVHLNDVPAAVNI